jgi:hypothetical protein
MKDRELLFAILPDGLEEYFEVENFKKDEELFRIKLIEKNLVPDNLPKEYQGRKIINNVLKEITIDSFPLRGRKCEIILKRRYWKFEGINNMYCNEINITATGTKLDKEFASFLKEIGRESSYTD